MDGLIRLMKKTVGIASIIAIAVSVGWYFFTDGAMSLNAAKRNIKQAAQDVVVAAGASPEDVAALAVKTINMTQGENGIELWRLKADWGNMRRNDDIMELEKPKFTYYMPPDNAEVTIASDKGEIDQEAQKIRFVANVVATLDGRVATAPLVIYQGKTREMVFPDGVEFSGAGISGKANRVVWRLQDKVIEAVGGIDMFFEDGEGAAVSQPETGKPSPANGAPSPIGGRG